MKSISPLRSESDKEEWVKKSPGQRIKYLIKNEVLYATVLALTCIAGIVSIVLVFGRGKILDERLKTDEKPIESSWLGSWDDVSFMPNAYAETTVDKSALSQKEHYKGWLIAACAVVVLGFFFVCVWQFFLSNDKDKVVAAKEWIQTCLGFFLGVLMGVVS